METAEESAEFVVGHGGEIVLHLRRARADRLTGLERGVPEIGIKLVHAADVSGLAAHQVDLRLGCVGETLAIEGQQFGIHERVK